MSTKRSCFDVLTSVLYLGQLLNTSGASLCMEDETMMCPVQILFAGRHALSELVVDQFIPNDTAMHADTARVQVLVTSFIDTFAVPSHCGSASYQGLGLIVQACITFC